MPKTAAKTEIADHEMPRGGEVVAFQAPRLPYHDAIKERFGVDKAGWNALVGAIFPAAKTVDSVCMALSYCRARNLDPFKRPVHIVPMWDSKQGRYVETVWPGIAELRTTAFRTGQYAGCDEAVFGPNIKRSFTGKVKSGGNWEEKTIEVEFPEYCRITVYRDLNGRVCKFVGPKVKWIEAYATIGASDLPNDMWQSRTEGQLEKCAEAAALRKAFPEELGNQLTAEEMEGRRIHEPRDVTPREEPPAPPPAPTVEPRAVEVIPPKPENVAPPQPAPKLEPMPHYPDDSVAWLLWLDDTLATFKDGDAFDTFWSDTIAPIFEELFPPDQEQAMASYRKHEARLAP